MLSAALVLAVSAYAIKDHVTNPSIARYYTIFSKGTYQFGNDGSVSERKAIIKAVWEISGERLWIGYGPGWKKLPVVARERGYMARWQASTDPVDGWAYRYFSYGEGRVNPHNLYMQLLFEGGVPGLLAYAALVLSLMLAGFKHWVRGGGVMVRSMGVATVLYVGVYAITGMAGGVWLPVSLLILMLWAMDEKNTPHSPR
jgi:O-antigen ligase